MTQEQKQLIFDCIVMLNGSAPQSILKLSDDEILKILENSASDAAIAAYKYNDEIDRLTNIVKNLNY